MESAQRVVPVTSAVLFAIALATPPPAQAQNCRFSSIQARIQRHELDPWKPVKTITLGEVFRVGAFKNNMAQFAECCVDLWLTTPDGAASQVANGAYVTTSRPGRYQLDISCGTLKGRAIVQVLPRETHTASPLVHGIGFDPTYDPGLDQRYFNTVRASGGTLAKASFNWDVLQRLQMEPVSWTATDTFVRESRRQGLELTAYAGSTPTWALPPDLPPVPSPKPGEPPSAPNEALFPPREVHTGKFEAFFQNLAGRYCTDPQRVRYYSFWNEPNGCGWGWQAPDGTWHRPCDGVQTTQEAARLKARSYATWLRRWYAAMKRGCPNTVLAVGGLDCNGRSGSGCRQFVEMLYEEGAGDSFDAVELHPYGDEVGKAGQDAVEYPINWQAVAAVTRALQDRGHGHKKLWLLEWGWKTQDEGTKAEAVKRALHMFRGNPYPNVAMARYLTLVDPPPLFGLYNADLTPRPSGSAFKGVATAPRLPDVVIEDLWWSPANPMAGDQVQIQVRVRNAGATSTAADVGVGYFVDGRYVGYGIRGPMAPGEVSAAFGMVQRWPATGGVFQVRAVVDDVNRFAEVDEANNRFAKSVFVGGSTNLIQNPGFETGVLAPWLKYPPGAPGIVAVESCCGNHTPGGRWNAYIQPQGQYVEIYQWVSVVPGRRYRLEAWVSTNGMAATLGWWSNANGGVMGQCGVTTAVFPNYARLACDVTVPTGTSSFNVHLWGNASPGLWAVADDWSLSPL